MKVAPAIALLAWGCTTNQPPVVGEPPTECFPQAPTSNDDVTRASGPVGWFIVPLPVSSPDCVGSTASSSYSSLTWRNGGTIRSDSVVLRTTTTSIAVGGRCHIKHIIRVDGGPARRPGTIQPCQIFALSPAWASLQSVDLVVDALTVESVRRDLASPIAWSETLSGPDECGDAALVESSALRLDAVAELSVPLAGLQRMIGSQSPLIAISVRIDAN